MSEQQTPRPVEEDPTAVAAEVAAVTETGQAASPPVADATPPADPAPATEERPEVENANGEVGGSTGHADDGGTSASDEAGSSADTGTDTEPSGSASTATESSGATGGDGESSESTATDTVSEAPVAPADTEPATAEPGGGIETDAAAAPAAATDDVSARAEETAAPADSALAPAQDAPAEEAPTPEAPAPAGDPAAPAEAAPAPTQDAPAPAGDTATPSESAPAPAGDAAESASTDEPPTPRPTPRPTPASMPKPSALPRRAPAPGAPAPAPAVIQPPVVDESREAAAAAAWGRVDPDGTVWVREAAGERSVGQYTGADTAEALAFYVRRFLDLHAQVLLFETRLPQLSVKEIDQTLANLSEALTEPTAVGDIDSLRERLETLRGHAAERRSQIAAERAAAKAKALEERTVIVESAEAIAAADPAKVHWRSSGDELRGLLDQWKEAQRSGPRLDRPSEDALWKRFSRARTSFDRQRGQYFAQLDATQAETKKAKEKLIAEAEALSSSTDWGRTSAAYRGLMDEWKRAGRASRKEDDALWARFRAAQQTFFDARDEQNAQIDAEYAANLEVKLALLVQAEAILPVTNPEAAKAALRPIQDKWEEAGKVPRSEMQRVEARMRAVEQAVREADQDRWHKTDPEKKARAEGAAAQLQDAIETLEKQLADAEASGDAKAVKRANEALEARKSWLAQVLRAAEG